ncbi:hypothetical protein ABBQ32_000490 [Trebouxia sp. C0010 RCD-2024]
MSQPAESAAVPDQLQRVSQGLPFPAAQITSDALPMLTPVHDPQPSAQAREPMSLQPAQAMPQASPRIKPPPSTGSFPHSQAGTPLWQMLGSASNLPGLGAGIFTGKESLDLDVLAKAAVARRKEQERQSAEAAARDSVIAELHRRAARQAATSGLAQQHAITWLQATADSEDAAYVKQHMDIIQALLSKESLLPESSAPASQPPIANATAGTAGLSGSAADVAIAGRASIIAAVHSAAVDQAKALSVAAAVQDPVVAATVTAAAAERAAAVVNAAVTDASHAEARANSTAAVAALQAAAVGGAAPAAAVAQAVGDAARALAAAKAKATATAEAALQAAVAQEQQRVEKHPRQHPHLPLLGGLVDYPSDEDSHMSRAQTDSQIKHPRDAGQAEVSSAERRAIAAQQGQSPSTTRGSQGVVQQPASSLSLLSWRQATQTTAGQSQEHHQPASLLPMYSIDPSGSYQQASSGGPGGAGDLQADATGRSPRAGLLADGAGLVGADMPCSRLSGQQLGEVLDSMRELSSVHMNLSLLSGTGVLAFVDRLTCSTAYAGGSKKKRKRDGWESKKGGKDAAALLWASGSAPEAQTLHQVSQARQALPATTEARRTKRDLHSLHFDPSTLPKPPAAPTPTPADPTPPQAAGLSAQPAVAEGMPPRADPTHPPAAQGGHPNLTPAVDVAAIGSSTAAAAAAAPQLASSQASALNTARNAAGDAVGMPGLAVPDGQSPSADGDSTQAPAKDDNPPEAGRAKEAAVLSSKSIRGASMETEPASTPATEAHAHDAGAVTAKTAGRGQTENPVTADAAGPVAEPPKGGSDQKPKQYSKAAAAGKPKGKRKPAPLQKGSFKKRQKLKQDDRASSEEAEAEAASAAEQAAAMDAGDEASSDEEPVVAAAAAAAMSAKTHSTKSKKAAAMVGPKGKAAPGQKGTGKASATAAHARKSGGGMTEKAGARANNKKTAAKRNTAETGAAASAAAASVFEDDDSMQHDHETADKAETGSEAEEEAAYEAAPAAAVARDRRAKGKETLKLPAKQSPQKGKKPAKQQKLQLSKGPTSGPKQSKASAAAAGSDAAADTGVAPAGKTAKGKAGSDRKFAASAEPTSGGKEGRGKQLKATPKSVPPQANTVAKSVKSAKPAKQQKQKTTADKTDDGGSAAAASAADSGEEEDLETRQQAGSAGREAAGKTPVERAVAYLTEQQNAIASSTYAQLKPLILATCKGTLQRLSKLPGWNRQSMRKKWVFN